MKIPKELADIKVGTLLIPVTNHALLMLHYGHITDIDSTGFTVMWKLTGHHQLDDPHMLHYSFTKKRGSGANWKTMLENNIMLHDEKEILVWKIKNS